MPEPTHQSGHDDAPDEPLASSAGAAPRRDADAAEAALREALARHPDDLSAVRDLGARLVERGEAASAVDLFAAAAVRVDPPSEATLAFYNNYANALRHASRLGEAEEVLLELVRACPQGWQPWHNLGQTLRDQHRYDEAERAMRQALGLEPGFGPNHGVLGEILLRLGRLEDADAELQACVDLGWASDPALWSTIGGCRRLLARLDDAAAAYERCLELGGRSALDHANLGLVLAELGRFDEAVAHLDTALLLDPRDARLRAHRAYVLLAAGRIPDAWDEWEHAFVLGLRGMHRPHPVPAWTPGDTDARVLVRREQGLGDELMFATCVPDLIEAAREVVVECDPRLVPLFARSFPTATIRAVSTDGSDGAAATDHDRAIWAGSLPRLFRRTVGDFPSRTAHLVADGRATARWSERLADLGPGPYVGIAWRSRLMTAQRRREYTRLRDWDDVLAVPGVTWVNLQYDDCEAELRAAELEFGVRIHRWDWLDLTNDLDEVAALTSALDLVVSARTAVPMLSGALGVRTVALGSPHSWSELGTGRLPWFDAVHPLHRAPNGEWGPALRAAAHAVAAATRGGRRTT